jgi:signal transduction histidine kinase
MEIVRRADQKTEPSEITIKLDGEERKFNVSSVPILFGGKDAFLLVLNDITEQKRYSEYLEKLSKKLQQQKIELEKINQELAEKNQELKELNSTKDKFFSIITHDLKSPIYGVKSLVSEFNDSFDILTDAEKREFISALFSSTSKLADLLENLLLWSRTQTRTLPYNPTDIDIKYLVENTVSFHYQSAKLKDIVILQRVEENASAYADVGCVTTILRNLISNAIKFTEQGGVIHISSETIEEGGIKYEKIAVADNGVGIPYEIQDKLLRFDFQHTSLGTSGERGTGLGLVIIRELVELNGGRIWFESKPNAGSTFYFTLPKKGNKK